MYLIDVNPTAENIARLIFDVALGQGFRSWTFVCGKRPAVVPAIARSIL